MSLLSSEQARLLRQALRRATKTSPDRPRAALLETEDGRAFAAPEVDAPSLAFCAERVVMFQARMAGATRFTRLTVAGVHRSPCGACLQVLHEFAPDLVIRTDDELEEAVPLRDLLPGAFGPEDLAAHRPRSRS